MRGYELIWGRVFITVALFVGILSATLTYLLTAAFTSLTVSLLTGFGISIGFVLMFTVNSSWRTATYLFTLQLFSPFGLFLTYFVMAWSMMIMPKSEDILHNYSQFKWNNTCIKSGNMSHQGAANVLGTIHYFPICALAILFSHTLLYVYNFEAPTCFATTNSGFAAEAKVWLSIFGYSLSSVIFVLSLLLSKFQSMLAVALRKLKEKLECQMESVSSHPGSESLLFAGLTVGFLFISFMGDAIHKIKVRFLRNRSMQPNKYKVGFFYFIKITGTEQTTSVNGQPLQEEMPSIPLNEIAATFDNNLQDINQQQPSAQQGQRIPDGWDD